jgi:hypothetical protein
MGFDSFARVFLSILPNEFVGVVRTLLLRVKIVEPLEGVNSDNDITCTGVRFAENVTLL